MPIRKFKKNRAAQARPCRGFWFETGLAVSASRLSATAATWATSATTTATALLSTSTCTCGTVASLRCGGASGRGNGLFAFLYLVGIRLVVDLEAFRFVVILVEIGSALEGDGRLAGRTFALGTRCALLTFAALAAVATLTTLVAVSAIPAAFATCGLREPQADRAWRAARAGQPCGRA